MNCRESVKAKNLSLVELSKILEEDILKYKQEHFVYGEKQVHGSGGHIAYGIRPL